MRRLFTLAALAFACAAFAPAPAQTAECFGAPATVRSSYLEPRVYAEAQSWWLEGQGDMLSSIQDAGQGASHVHLGLCYPQGETIQNDNGSYPWSLEGKLHQFVGGSAGFVRGGGFLIDSAMQQFNIVPTWKPSLQDEARTFQLATPVSKVTSCGRKENRFTLNTTPPQGGTRRQYQSFGLQTYVPCRPGQTASNYRSSDVMIFRSWYTGAGYTNVSFTDENAHSYLGFRASGMDDPVPAGWTVKFSLGEGANRYSVLLDPDIHHGSYGMPLAQNVAGTSGTVTIPSVLAPGIHRLVLVGCERIASPAGQACGVGVIPFQVGP